MAAVREGRLLARAARARPPPASTRLLDDLAEATAHDVDADAQLAGARRAPSTSRASCPTCAAPQSSASPPAANIAVGEVPLGPAAGRRASRPGELGARAAGPWSCRSATRTGAPRWPLSARAARAVVVEWGWPGPYDGPVAADLHAWLLSSRGRRRGRAAANGRVGAVTAALSVGPRHRGDQDARARASTRDGAILAEVREPTEPGAEGVVRYGRPGRSRRCASRPAGRSTARRGRHPRPRRRRARARSSTRSTSASTATGCPLRRAAGGAARRARSSSRTTSTRPPSAPPRSSGAADLVYLSIGTGLAAGMVLDGRLRRGRPRRRRRDRPRAGRPARARVCQCGQRGCLETIASGSALAAAWPSGDVPPAQALFAAAAAGDPARSRSATGSRPASPSAIRVLSLAVDPAQRRAGWRRRPARRAAAGRGRARRCSTRPRARRSWPRSTWPAGCGWSRPTIPVAAVGAALLGRR